MVVEDVPNFAPPSRRPSKGFSAALAGVALLAMGFTAFQRLTTRANIDEIQYFQNIRGGFLAVGMTPSQPGILLLSALDKQEVNIEAILRQNAWTGTSTSINLDTSAGQWQWRLRNPLIITIDTSGIAHAERTPLGLDHFERIKQAVDCADANAHGHQRCGVPFDELAELSTRWPDKLRPKVLSDFLKQHAETQPAGKSDQKLTRARPNLSGVPCIIDPASDSPVNPN